MPKKSPKFKSTDTFLVAIGKLTRLRLAIGDVPGEVAGTIYNKEAAEHTPVPTVADLEVKGGPKNADRHFSQIRHRQKKQHQIIEAICKAITKIGDYNPALDADEFLCHTDEEFAKELDLHNRLIEEAGMKRGGKRPPTKAESDSAAVRVDSVVDQEENLVRLISRTQREQIHNTVDEAKKATDRIWLLAELPAKVLSRNSITDFTQKVADGCDIRFIMLAPRHESLRGFLPHHDGFDDATAVLKSLKSVAEVYEYLSTDVELRVWPGPFTYSLLLTSSAESHVARVEFRVPLESAWNRPNILLSKQAHPDWFAFFENQFEKLWDEVGPNVEPSQLLADIDECMSEVQSKKA